MKGMKTLFLVMLLTTGVALLWDRLSFIKLSVHAILDPTLGIFLNWSPALGLFSITVLIVLITTLVQKYATDQKTLKELKDEQKLLGEEMKKFKEHPEKMMALQQKQFELIGKTMPLTMRPALFTAIPFVLLLRWFNDYFITNPVKIFGMSWFWAYFVITIILSMILRKIMKVQ